MSGFLILILFLVVIGVAVVGVQLLFRHRAPQRSGAEIIADPNLLAHWVYAPDEWRKAVEDEFNWVKNKESVGHVYISPTAICVKNDFQERVIELAGGGKVVTNASYRGANGSPLKLRTRWRVVEQSHYGHDEVKYYKKDYWIPVPLQYKEEARRVAEFFTAQIENNMAAYTAVVPDNEPISLFGKDTF
jgi:hypothetical protein